MSSSSHESVDVVRTFNDMVLKGPGVNSYGAFKTELPRMPGELVARKGYAISPGGSYLTSNPWLKPTIEELKVPTFKFPNATGRKTASGTLRGNTEAVIRIYQKRKAKVSTHNMNNQAQHVVPYALANHTSVVKLYDVNSEHPFNSQLLPNRTEFSSEMQSVLGSGWGASKKSVFSVPSSSNYDSLTGSFHQGYHSAYNQGMHGAFDFLRKNLASLNKGVLTSAMVEGAIFHVQKGGRSYASQLYPLYRRFDAKTPLMVFPHFDSSDKKAIMSATSQPRSMLQNRELGKFAASKILALGQG